MRVITQDSIDISESLAAFLLSSHIYHSHEVDPLLEKRLKYVKTGKYSIADIYHPKRDAAIEVKSKAHGNGALKGVVQASMYKEQTSDAIFCMQKPSRKNLVNTIESFAEDHGVGIIWITGVPNICSEDMIESATGGCSKPFEMWKSLSYTSTRSAIIANSTTSYIEDYVSTLEQIVTHNTDDIFDFAIAPNKEIDGLYYKYLR